MPRIGRFRPAAPGQSAVLRSAVAVLLLALATLRPSAATMEILVPAYFYPTLGPEWGQLALAAPRVPLTVILNPASGPGIAPDPNYVTVVSQLRAAGGRVIGYVDTNYGQRNPALVQADIDLYPTFYQVDGIFLDQMANDTLAAHYAYYADLYGYIKTHHPTFRVVGNPGTWTQEAYVALPTVDTVCTYENSTPYPDYVPDPWVYGYPADRFYHIAHTVPTASEMRADLALAVSHNVGSIFITDHVMPNPYDRLPVYWDQEVAAVESLRVATAPPAAPIEAGLRVFPNPARGRCEIRPETGAAPLRDVRLFDPAGRAVYAWRSAPGEATLVWPGLDAAGRAAPPGVYYLRAIDGRGREFRASPRLIR